MRFFLCDTQYHALAKLDVNSHMLHVYDNIYAFREMKCKREDFERTVASVPQWEPDFQIFLKGVLICFTRRPYASVKFLNQFVIRVTNLNLL